MEWLCFIKILELTALSLYGHELIQPIGHNLSLDICSSWSHYIMYFTWRTVQRISPSLSLSLPPLLLTSPPPNWFPCLWLKDTSEHKHLHLALQTIAVWAALINNTIMSYWPSIEVDWWGNSPPHKHSCECRPAPITTEMLLSNCIRAQRPDNAVFGRPWMGELQLRAAVKGWPGKGIISTQRYVHECTYAHWGYIHAVLFVRPWAFNHVEHTCT